MASKKVNELDISIIQETKELEIKVADSPIHKIEIYSVQDNGVDLILKYLPQKIHLSPTHELTLITYMILERQFEGTKTLMTPKKDHWWKENGNRLFEILKNHNVDLLSENYNPLITVNATSHFLSYMQYFKEGKSLLNTLLKQAVEQNDDMQVKQALMFGADPNLKTPRFPLLHFAVKQGKLEIAKLLLNYGANINDTDNQGNSVLDIVIEGKTTQVKFAQYLIQNGAHFMKVSFNSLPYSLKLTLYDEIQKYIEAEEIILKQIRKIDENKLDTIEFLKLINKDFAKYQDLPLIQQNNIQKAVLQINKILITNKDLETYGMDQMIKKFVTTIQSEKNKEICLLVNFISRAIENDSFREVTIEDTTLVDKKVLDHSEYYTEKVTADIENPALKVSDILNEDTAFEQSKLSGELNKAQE